jgi:hypothetical protein
MPHRIFISHAAADAELAGALLELLRLGADAQRRDLFCTSVTGTDIAPGSDFVDVVRERLADAELVVQLITPAFLESTFCLCELGAQWVLAKDAFPLVVPPITHADLQAVQRTIHVGRIDDGADLDKLFDRICALLGEDPGTDNWNLYRSRFLVELRTKLLGRVRPATRVDREMYDGAVAVLQAEQQRGERLQAEGAELRDKLARMAEAKDSAEAAAILVGDDEQAEFDRLVEAARVALEALPWIVREVVYYDHAGLEFVPEQEVMEDVNRAIVNRYLQPLDPSEGREAVLNHRDREVARAVAAIENLATFQPSPEMAQAFEVEHDFALDFKNRRVWSRLGL